MLYLEFSNTMKLNKRFFILVVAAIILIVTVLFLVISTGKINSNSTSNAITISVDNKVDPIKVYSIAYSEEDGNLTDTLIRLEELNSSFTYGYSLDATLGMYITSISGYQPDITKNENWVTTINGSTSEGSNLDYKAAGGDDIKFEINNI